MGISAYGVEYDISQLNSYQIAVGRPAAGRVAGVTVETAKVSINSGSNTTIAYEVELEAGTTALTALQSTAKAYNLNLQTKTYEGLGVLVEGIGDKIGGQDNKYWSFYYNGQSATVAADQQILQAGDKVGFVFQESLF